MLAARPFTLGLTLFRVFLPGRFGSRWVRLALLLGLLAPLTAVLAPPQASWERAHFSVVAYAGLAVTCFAWDSAGGRARRVRAWICFGGFGTWTLIQVLKNVEYIAPAGISPDILLVGVTVAATGAYRAVLAGRVPWREELAVYLDAAVVTATASAVMITVLASSEFGSMEQTALLYAIVFVGILSATAILDLSVLAELRPRGAYALLVGIAALAVGFVVRGLPGTDGSLYATAGWLTSGGVVLAAYGTATWNDVVDDRRHYVRIAGWLRSVAPLGAVVLTPVLLLHQQGEAGSPLTLAVQGLSVFALIGVAARQSLLLHEREGMVGGLTAARGAAERRTQQIAGLEEVGRLLASTGPTEPAMSNVVEVIHERFGYAHVAIYLAEGDLLRLVGQRGYQDLFPTLNGRTGVVGRVKSTHRAELIADVSLDPDYLMADHRIRSEICAPLLDGGEFLGVLDIESAAEEPLDETDLAAVVAVADRVAGAVALALRRQRLLLERNFTAALLDTVAAAIVVTNAAGRVVRFNPACAEISGYSMEELGRHTSFEFLVPPEQRAAVASVVGDVTHAAAPRNAENDWLHIDGTRRRLSWSNRPLLDEDGSVAFVLATGIDITERKQLEDQLAHRALHDPLTNLPNRALLTDRLEQALKRRRTTGTVGVLFVDLDNFKLINDTLGHEAGDLVLMRVARELRASLRPEDTAARVGGDEFAAVLEGIDGATDGWAIGERVREAIAGLRIVVRGVPVTVSASVGITTGLDGTNDAGDLLRNADIAMYAAKASGGATTAVFRESMFDSMVEKRDIERLLAAAVSEQQLVVNYQPILRLRDRRLVGAEALVRWSHPTRGIVYPAEFLGVAESTGLIAPIGAHVLREASRQMAEWVNDDARHAPDWISVNVSPRQFTDPHFADHVCSALERAGLAPNRLMIEITESLMMEVSETSTAALNRLRGLGVRFAIDDFGSGYSGLSYLPRFPIELLKIDRSLISGVESEPKQRSFVAALVAMGASLGLRVLAEGIETEPQYRAVRGLDCELGQGYFLGSPAAGGAGLGRPRRVRRAGG